MRGDIVPFIHISDKSWTLWFDCVPTGQIEEIVNKRLSQGFRRIEQTQVIEEDPDDSKPMFRSRTWRSRQKQTDEKKKSERTDLALVEGKMYQIEIGGDVIVCDDDLGRHNLGLQFHDKLPDNYRRFAVEPHPPEEGKMCTGIIKVFADEGRTEEGGSGTLRCWRTFDYDVDPNAVKAYMYVEPEPEPRPVTNHVQEVVITAPEPIRLPPKKPEKPKPTLSEETFLRLITPIKPPRKGMYNKQKSQHIHYWRALSCLESWLPRIK